MLCFVNYSVLSLLAFLSFFLFQLFQIACAKEMLLCYLDFCIVCRSTIQVIIRGATATVEVASFKPYVVY